MLASVVAKEFLVEFSSDPAHNDIFGGLHLRSGLRQGSKELRSFERVHVQPVEAVESVEIDGHRQQLAVNARQHMMLIRSPLRELRQVLENFQAVGVKNMWPVPVNEDAVLVVMVERVATDVGATID